jgi:DMSO/TMAO reductase YedYZ molybdopterin-dependent catalytic subunit
MLDERSKGVVAITTRRSLLQTAASGLIVAGSGGFAQLVRAGLPSGTIESQLLDALPGKVPLLKHSFRPPNYETPVEYLQDAITPNDRFFVRWHLADIPTVDAASWRVKIGGDAAERPFDLTLEQLMREFDPVEVVAVCQCAGNRRGLSDPHVPGVQWGEGAVGNARWKGARLKDVLTRAGLKPEAVEVAFDGADGPVLEATPDFVKSLPVWKAVEDNTLVAYEMNGAPLPHWNGFPARLIVPGWAATYWVKQLISISALTQPLKSFWMNTAYRIPKGKFPSVDRFISQESETTTPVTEIDVFSLMTNISDGQRFTIGTPIELRGIAWDPGYGIRRVEVSLDEGRIWQTAQLGADLGRFSFRPWQFAFTPRSKGDMSVFSRAINAQGIVQTEAWIANPAGYHNNIVQKIAIHIA